MQLQDRALFDLLLREKSEAAPTNIVDIRHPERDHIGLGRMLDKCKDAEPYASTPVLHRYILFHYKIPTWVDPLVNDCIILARRKIETVVLPQNFLKKAPASKAVPIRNPG